MIELTEKELWRLWEEAFVSEAPPAGVLSLEQAASAVVAIMGAQTVKERLYEFRHELSK